MFKQIGSATPGSGSAFQPSMHRYFCFPDQSQDTQILLETSVSTSRTSDALMTLWSLGFLYAFPPYFWSQIFWTKSNRRRQSCFAWPHSASGDLSFPACWNHQFFMGIITQYANPGFHLPSRPSLALSYRMESEKPAQGFSDQVIQTMMADQRSSTSRFLQEFL